MIASFRDAVRLPDLRKRVFFTLFVLLVYRLGTHIPMPGVDTEALARLFKEGGVLGFLDLFAGGALSRFSIFSLGVVPYINSSIVMQLLVIIFPALERLQKEGEEGRRKILQYTRYGAVVFALLQALGLSYWASSVGVVREASVLSRMAMVVTITAGSMALMWLGELIGDHGIGNGVSLIIFAGIVARIPAALVSTISLLRVGELSLLSLLLALVILVAVIAGVIVVQEGQRRLPVQYAKRVVGRRVYGGQSTFIPLRVNQAGVIPIIFASSVMLFPSTLARFLPGDLAASVNAWLSPSSVLYMSVYAVLVVFFTFFYTAVVFNPDEIAENMKKYGGFILGIRPGKPTAEYIEKVLSRVTFGGGVFLALIAVLPNVVDSLLGVHTFYLGGTAVLIVVGVALDTVHQIEAQLLLRHYDGILKRRGKELFKF